VFVYIYWNAMKLDVAKAALRLLAEHSSQTYISTHAIHNCLELATAAKYCYKVTRVKEEEEEMVHLSLS